MCVYEDVDVTEFGRGESSTLALQSVVVVPATLASR